MRTVNFQQFSSVLCSYLSFFSSFTAHTYHALRMVGVGSLWAFAT
jgi:hypothetical protein